MDYQKIYDDLIERGRNRTPVKGIHTERHHVIPKCMKGLNVPDNIVKLTGSEHYVAHLLLYRIHRNDPGGLPHKLLVSIMRMGSSLVTRNRMSRNKLYERARAAFSKAMSERRHSETTIQRMKDSWTPERKEVFSTLKTGGTLPQTAVEAIREKATGRKHSEATIQKLVEAHTGVSFSEEHKQGMKDAWDRKRQNGEVLGHPVSDKVKLHLSIINTGKTLPQETRDKISRSLRETLARKKVLKCQT